jgi:hypothetical protein
MSLVTGIKKTAISVRKDPNITTKPGIRIQSSVVVNIPPQIGYSPSFNPNGTISTPNLLDLARRITNNWFPPDNFTNRAVPAGNLVVNGQSVGKMDIVVIPGQTLNNTNINSVFTETKDTASSFIFVKGNLTVGDILTPPTRKLFTVIYVSGNLTMQAGSQISMTRRGANHSGVGDSGGYVAPVPIAIGPSTTISATGGDGALQNSTEISANQGTNGDTTQNTLQTGGGGGGFWDYLNEGGGPSTPPPEQPPE